jgi:hypothetical protein
LEELSFKRLKPLRFGVSYDTNYRRHKYPDDIAWIGEGDLRYLTEKNNQTILITNNHEISSSEYGSDYDFPNALVEQFSPLFDRLEKALGGLPGDSPILALAACSRIQFALRSLMSEERAFPVDEITKVITETCELLEELKELQDAS